jgi:hypothetical protein
MKVYEPSEVRTIFFLIEDGEELWGPLKEFVGKYSSYNKAELTIPKFWSATVLPFLQEMLKVDDGLKFSKVINDDGILSISHSYSSKDKDKMDDIKLRAALAVDKLIMEKVVEYEEDNKFNYGVIG